jgi:hypothetical protein
MLLRYRFCRRFNKSTDVLQDPGYAFVQGFQSKTGQPKATAKGEAEGTVKNQPKYI